MNGSSKAEDILEALWLAVVEESKKSVSLAELDIRCDDKALLELTEKSYVEVKRGQVFLLHDGRNEGQQVVRRHRLAERLMMDIFDLKEANAVKKACEFEHLLNEGIDTKICTLLNHPKTCPHGRAIAPGPCCLQARQNRGRGVVPLTEMKVGEVGEIAYLSTADPKKMQKLMSMGVLPGNSIRLSRTSPAYIFYLGNSSFAVDEQLAQEIFVRQT